MTIYEFKMYLKRLSIVKFILKKYREKEEKTKELALKDNGIELISEIEKALKNVGVCYFADYGTLLGIIRDHSFISWDNDIDYGLLVEDSFNWKTFESDLNKYGFRKIREFFFKNKILEQTYAYGNLTVDFFGHICSKEKTYGFSFFRMENYIYQSKNEFHVRTTEYAKIYETKIVNFLGINVSVPCNAEEYLESVYTKKWKTPDPTWSNDENPNKTIKILDELGNGYFYE